MFEKDYLGGSIHWTLKMASAKLDETSVTNNSRSQSSNHLDDLFQSRNDSQNVSISSLILDCGKENTM